MENFAYSSYPESGDSSPGSREIECEAAASWDEPPPPTAARIKLMCSYGGRIQPRSHDNQLTYFGGDTKILAVDRSIRYQSIIAKLSVLYGSDDIILKYQFPGEDLDALISVTNDEDLEHMMMEYDRLHRTGSKPVPRLRLFLFAGMGKNSQDHACFAGPPSPVVTMTPKEGPDYLFGLEAADFCQPKAEVKDQALEKAGIEVLAARSEAEVVVSQAELQMHVQELQKLQITENQQQVSSIQINGSEETLTRAYPPPADYYVTPALQEKAPPAPAPAYWQEHQRNVAPAERFASFVGGDGNLYLIPANAGVYPANAAPGQSYYTVQRMVPAGAFDGTASMYAAMPRQPAKPAAAYDNGVRTQKVEVNRGYAPPPAGAYDNGAGYAVGYDSAGRPVYYAGAAATYNSLAVGAESKGLKPSQVS